MVTVPPVTTVNRAGITVVAYGGKHTRSALARIARAWVLVITLQFLT